MKWPCSFASPVVRVAVSDVGVLGDYLQREQPGPVPAPSRPGPARPGLCFCL